MAAHQVTPFSPGTTEAPGYDMRVAGQGDARKDTRLKVQASSQARRLRDVLADLMQRDSKD